VYLGLGLRLGSGTFAKVLSSSLLNDLLAYWKLDTTSWSDSSGNGYTLTNNNGVSVGTGKISGDAVFDGTTGNYLYNSSVDLAGNYVSCCFWMKFFTPENQFSTILGKGNNSDNQLTYFFYEGEIYTGLQTADGFNQLNSGLGFGDGNWHFYASTYNGIDLNFYVDGSIVNNVAQSGAISPLSSYFGIGRFEYDGFDDIQLNCEIDECGVWNRGLTQAEITSLYNAGAGKTYPFT